MTERWKTYCLVVLVVLEVARAGAWLYDKNQRFEGMWAYLDGQARRTAPPGATAPKPPPAPTPTP